MNIGIDKLGFFTSHLYLDMKDLALARNVDPNKYLIGIGQSKMSVIPPTQDAVSMAANAVNNLHLTKDEVNQTDMILFATESGVDNSKSGAVYIQKLLGFNHQIRVIELKQACYAATAAIHFAQGHILQHPNSRVIIIGSDNSRYGLNSKGEPTQGGGAIAMSMCQNPRLLSIKDDATYWADDLMDFWRPLGHSEALVESRYSVNAYLEFFKLVFNEYKKLYKIDISDFGALLFHLPYTKEGFKALKLAIHDADSYTSKRLLEEFEYVRNYSNQVGNLYTGSLYLGLLSLLENATNLKSGMRLGLYSYGSGAQGEFYTAILQPSFNNYIHHKSVQKYLDSREKVTINQYEKIYNSRIGDERTRLLDYDNDPSKFVFAGVENYQRQYIAK